MNGFAYPPTGSTGPLISLVREIHDVLLPRGCAGCDKPDERLCSSCRRGFSLCMTRRMPGSLFSAGCVYACGEYRGSVRRAILQWKDHGDEEITGDLCFALERCVRESGVGRKLSRYDHVLVVPVPSSPTSMRSRGRRHTLPLAVSVARCLTAQGVRAEADSILSITGVRSKSVQQRGAVERSARLADHIMVQPRLIPDGGNAHQMYPVVLVDDIATTGSTLRQCAKTLREAHLPVITAFVLAQVPDAVRSSSVM